MISQTDKSTVKYVPTNRKPSLKLVRKYYVKILLKFSLTYISKYLTFLCKIQRIHIISTSTRIMDNIDQMYHLQTEYSMRSKISGINIFKGVLTILQRLKHWKKQIVKVIPLLKLNLSNKTFEETLQFALCYILNVSNMLQDNINSLTFQNAIPNHSSAN